MEKIGRWQDQSFISENKEDRSATFIELKQRGVSNDLIMLSNNRKIDFRSKSYSGSINKFNERNIFREAVHNNFNFINGINKEDDMENPSPRISSAAQLIEYQNMLMKTVLAADSISLDLTLKRMNYGLDITDIVGSENGYTLLHCAVFKDCDQIVYSLCKNIMENPAESTEFKKKKMISWINKKTEGKEGFTAIHLAAFNGNLSIIRFLENHGGDIYADNNYNLNGLHVAAQGNQPAAVVYFLNKNVDINCRDKVKSTPLHWACYAGAENSVCYLIAYGADPNLQDIDGYTALHCAVKSIEYIKSSRIVKQLLFAGAKRNISNNDGMKPIDFLHSVNIAHIVQEIK